MRSQTTIELYRVLQIATAAVALCDWPILVILGPEEKDLIYGLLCKGHLSSGWTKNSTWSCLCVYSEIKIPLKLRCLNLGSCIPETSVVAQVFDTVGGNSLCCGNNLFCCVGE